MDESDLYSGLRAVLVKYMSDPVADSMLGVACRRVAVEPGALGQDRIEAVLEELSYGIRLFCADARVPDMMRELADLVE